MFVGVLSTQFNVEQGFKVEENTASNNQNTDFNDIDQILDAAPVPKADAAALAENAELMSTVQQKSATSTKSQKSQETFQTESIASVQSVNKMSASMKYTKIEMNVSNHAGKLEWASSYQRNVKQFFIEKSLDDENFEVIGKLAGEGVGEFNKELEYSFEDSSLMHVQMPRIYYRIKQEGINGDHSYSDVIEHDFGLPVGLYASVLIKPDNQAVIQYAADKTGPVTYQVLDVLGNLVKEGQLQADFTPQSLVLDLNDWEKGTYYLSLDDETHSFMQNFEFQ